MSYFAVALQQAMKERAVTQTKLSRLVDISQAQISEYLRDDSRPDTQRLGRICLALEEHAVPILIAFLRDAIPPELDGAVEILPTSGRARVQEPPALFLSYNRLSPGVQSLLDTIAREAAHSPKLIRALESTIDLFHGR